MKEDILAVIERQIRFIQAKDDAEISDDDRNWLARVYNSVHDHSGDDQHFKKGATITDFLDALFLEEAADGSPDADAAPPKPKRKPRKKAQAGVEKD
jgi:hypothetical protein